MTLGQAYKLIQARNAVGDVVKQAVTFQVQQRRVELEQSLGIRSIWDK